MRKAGADHPGSSLASRPLGRDRKVLEACIRARRRVRKKRSLRRPSELLEESLGFARSTFPGPQQVSKALLKNLCLVRLGLAHLADYLGEDRCLTPNASPLGVLVQVPPGSLDSGRHAKRNCLGS